jgi:hypothetical protein
MFHGPREPDEIPFTNEREYASLIESDFQKIFKMLNPRTPLFGLMFRFRHHGRNAPIFAERNQSRSRSQLKFSMGMVDSQIQPGNQYRVDERDPIIHGHTMCQNAMFLSIIQIIRWRTSIRLRVSHSYSVCYSDFIHIIDWWYGGHSTALLLFFRYDLARSCQSSSPDKRGISQAAPPIPSPSNSEGRSRK